MVGLGPVETPYDELEQINEKKENLRLAVANGLKCLKDVNEKLEEVLVDDCTDPQAVSEGVHLANFRFDELKRANSSKNEIKFSLFQDNKLFLKSWNRGALLAKGQNIARRLSEMPANLMTPTIFAQEAQNLTQNTDVKLIIRDKAWAQSKGMGSFLSVAQGSDQAPIFLELHYNNLPKSNKPIVYVGKGITFDSGGISLKPSADMDLMRADMSGAAQVLSTIVTLAALKAQVNIIGLIPLTENLINGHATKPGDVVIAMNGRTIKIDNTDAEGRLVLADALCYSSEFDPVAVVDIATLTGAMKVTLASTAVGIWTTTSNLWDLILKSSIESGDRVWRMPLFKEFTKSVTDDPIADLNNMGSLGRFGGSNVASAFLRQFVSCPNWMHVDMASVMHHKSDSGYLCKGMTGRPFRTMVNFFEKYFEEC